MNTSTNTNTPGANQIAVTDESVSPDHQGAGILIRRLHPNRKAQRQQQTTRHRRRQRTDASSDNSDENDDKNKNKNNTNNSSYKDYNNNRRKLLYRPRPGDTCVVRYDCYTLSPILTTRTRTGEIRIADHQDTSTSTTQQQQQRGRHRRRTWVDGNFETESGRFSPESIGGTATVGTDHRSHFLPALEFVVGSGDVVRGMEVVVQRMSRGDAVEATVPHVYGYGFSGLPPRIPPRADLVLVIRLVAVVPTPENRRAHCRELEQLDNGNGNGNNTATKRMGTFGGGIVAKTLEFFWNAVVMVVGAVILFYWFESIVETLTQSIVSVVLGLDNDN